MKPPDNDKQRRFCELYVENLDRAAAYKGANYSTNTEASTYNAASRLLGDVCCSRYIDYLLNKQQRSRVQLRARIVQERERLAFANIADCIKIDSEGLVTSKDPKDLPRDLTAAIRTIWAEKKVTRIPGGGEEVTVTTKMEMHSKEGSLKSLEKMTGLDSDLNSAIAVLDKYGIELKQDGNEWYVSRPDNTTADANESEAGSSTEA